MSILTRWKELEEDAIRVEFVEHNSDVPNDVGMRDSFPKVDRMDGG